MAATSSRICGRRWSGPDRRALERFDCGAEETPPSRFRGAGEPLQAALRFQQAARLQPELASGSGALASLMARAFRNDYEAGEFDAAFN